MPRRPYARVSNQLIQPVIASPRTFGGGRVVCRTIPEEQIDISESVHTSATVDLPAIMSGPLAFKSNVSIFCAGPWVYPQFYEADFQVRYVVDGQVWDRPNVRRSIVWGEMITNYDAYPDDSPPSNTDVVPKWGANSVNETWPVGIYFHLNGILTPAGAPTVGFEITNRSTNLSGYASMEAHVTTIAVAAIDADTFEA